MPRRLSPIMLLSIVIVLVLSLGLFAGAGGAEQAALSQVGKPYAFGTDGPGTFSCTGLVRFALRSIGIMDAPWDHYAYLSAYPNVSKPQPGDVVVYPDGAAMYIGNDQVVMANHADGKVGTYPMGAIGIPVGFARPTATQSDPTMTQSDPTMTQSDPTMTQSDPTMTQSDPTMTQSDGKTGDQTPVGDTAPAGDEAPVIFDESQGGLATQSDPTMTQSDPPPPEGGLAPVGDAMLAEQQAPV